MLRVRVSRVLPIGCLQEMTLGCSITRIQNGRALEEELLGRVCQDRARVGTVESRGGEEAGVGTGLLRNDDARSIERRRRDGSRSRGRVGVGVRDELWHGARCKPLFTLVEHGLGHGIKLRDTWFGYGQGHGRRTLDGHLRRFRRLVVWG